MIFKVKDAILADQPEPFSTRVSSEHMLTNTPGNSHQ